MIDRLAARAARKALPEETRAVWSQDILRHLQGWEVYRTARTVMAYASFEAEVQTGALLADILRSGKRLVLPRCETGGVMRGHLVPTLDVLTPGTWGIPEPAVDAPVIAREDMDLILVPGLLFDRGGNRMGQGAGYYDRYLAGYEGTTCALAYAMQVMDRLRPKAHDVPMRWICTQEGLVKGTWEG